MEIERTYKQMRGYFNTLDARSLNSFFKEEISDTRSAVRHVIAVRLPAVHKETPSPKKTGCKKSG
jgi:hypothetical protein